MSATLDLAKQLIQNRSVTPVDGGCQSIIAERLSKLGFVIESLPFADVSNLWAAIGEDGPLLVFAGHTDVVPPGPLEEWTSSPFTPTERDGYLYGRGAADMKGSLAAMIVATERQFAQSADLPLNARLGFLITSDEEGDAIDGTRRVIQSLADRKQSIDYCIVGEPSSTEKVGDTIKIGRRGSLSGKLKIIGIQGHVAYPQLARNPIHIGIPVLDAIKRIEWDQGNAAFPATSFQISNIHAGTGANNVIPEAMEVDFNLRFSTEITAENIKQRIGKVLDQAKISYELKWHLSGEPFLTVAERLIDVVSQSVFEVTGLTPEKSTAGGTSDGRFIAPTGAELVELGPCNASIHKVDERVGIDELDQLTDIYQAIIRRIVFKS